jgi:hypothetical protein
MLIVLVFCSLSLFLENLTGVPLFVSCDCYSGYSILVGTGALLLAPLMNLLVEPRNTLLMRPMVLSPSNKLDVGTLLVREALVDW